MHQRFHLFDFKKIVVGGGVSALLLAGCRHDTVVVPAYDEYFPLVLNTYRSYAVVDSTWTNGAVTIQQYQLRERVAEQFADATGQPAYRLVRSKRADATAAWVDDSVVVVQPLTRAVLLTRSNVRTVELVYPPQAGKKWNRTAFTVNGQASTYSDVVDTITSLNRYYGASVSAAYTTAAAGGAAAKTYATTVTVADVMPTQINDGLYEQSAYQQVFAKGVGRVLRRYYHYRKYYYVAGNQQILTPGIQSGTSRRETLIDAGTI